MTALFQARGVTKSFGGLTAVAGVDFTLESGIASIIGPNGAGKTTLFNCFTGLYVPEKGEVTFNGHSLLGLRPDQITAFGICRTFQNIRLFGNMTALENVLVGMHARIPLRLRDVLTRGPKFHDVEHGLWSRAEALLHRVGLNGDPNAVARNLPYGDQRRLEIARALASDPKLLLLDEPTAGMNPVEVEAVAALIAKVATEGHSVLLVEHNVRLVMDVCHTITVLNFGKVIAEGPPAKVAEDPAVITAYLGGPA